MITGVFACLSACLFVCLSVFLIFSKAMNQSFCIFVFWFWAKKKQSPFGKDLVHILETKKSTPVEIYALQVLSSSVYV